MLRYEQNICALWLDHMWPGHKSPVNRLLGSHDFPLYLRISGHLGCNCGPLRTIMHVIAMHTGERGIEMARKNIGQERQAIGYSQKATEFAAAGNQAKATWYNNAAVTPEMPRYA